MKKLIKHIKYAVVSLSIVTTTSCSEDFLENINKDQPSVGVIYENVENAQLALTGLIGSMTDEINRGTSAPAASGEQSGGYPIQIIQMDNLGEDIPWFEESFALRYKTAYTWEILNGVDNSLIEHSWGHSYAIIAQANLILDNIDNVPGPQTAKDNIKGQALTVRAFTYLHLVQLFGNRFEVGTDNAQLGPILYTSAVQETQPRNTVGQTYTLINNDLKMAIGLLDEERQSKYFINKAVAQGVMARAALIQEDWDTAIAMANAAMASFPLMSNEEYQNGFNSVANEEWLWAWPRERFNNNGGAGFGNFWPNIAWNGGTFQIRSNPKRILSTLYNEVENISATDIRLANFSKDLPGDDRFVDIDDEGNPLTAFTFRRYTRTPYHAFKFKAVDFRNGDNQQGDTPAMRAAEMFLIKAEAQQRSGNDGVAANTLLQLNTNRDANAILSSNTGQALLEEIWLYRRLELWGEGFRFKDLKRNNLPLDRTGANHSANAGQVLEVPAGDARWTYPIPEIESRINPNL